MEAINLCMEKYISFLACPQAVFISTAFMYLSIIKCILVYMPEL